MHNHCNMTGYCEFEFVSGFISQGMNVKLAFLKVKSLRLSNLLRPQVFASRPDALPEAYQKERSAIKIGFCSTTPALFYLVILAFCQKLSESVNICKLSDFVLKCYTVLHTSCCSSVFAHVEILQICQEFEGLLERVRPFEKDEVLSSARLPWLGPLDPDTFRILNLLHSESSMALWRPWKPWAETLAEMKRFAASSMTCPSLINRCPDRWWLCWHPFCFFLSFEQGDCLRWQFAWRVGCLGYLGIDNRRCPVRWPLLQWARSIVRRCRAVRCQMQLCTTCRYGVDHL